MREILKEEELIADEAELALHEAVMRDGPRSQRERVVGGEGILRPRRELRIDRRCEIVPACRLTGQILIGLGQSRATRPDDLRPTVVQLEPEPIEEKHRAANGGVACVGGVREVHKVRTGFEAKPHARRNEIRRLYALVDVVCEHTRQTFASAGSAVPAVTEIRHENFVGFGNQQGSDEIDVGGRFASHRYVGPHAA